MGWWVAGGDKCQSRATIYVNGPQAVPGSVTVTAILFTTGELTVVLCTTVTQCMVSVYSVPVTHLVDVVQSSPSPRTELVLSFHFILISPSVYKAFTITEHNTVQTLSRYLSLKSFDP